MRAYPVDLRERVVTEVATGAAHAEAAARFAVGVARVVRWVREPVEAAGCRLLFLPPYSPDSNPIELLFSPVKGRLRTAAARTPDDLLAAVASALAAVTPDHARARYAHRRYTLPDR